MAKIDIPFNMNYSYSDNLREVPEDSTQMLKGVDWLNEELIRVSPIDQLQSAMLLHMLCVYCRITGDYKSAETCGKDAIKVFKEKGKSELGFFMKLRMAQVFHYKNSYSTAGDIYTQALETIEKSKSAQVKKYLEFVLFHYGCLKFERKFYAEANSLFSRALDARLIAGDIQKIKDTEYALRLVNEHLN